MSYKILETCIGCTACTKRCPTDAITGERKALHIISPELCIDCGACGPVCPVDAILDQYGNVQRMLKKNERPIAFVYEQACTGCEKCVERCPFEAREMVPVKDPSSFLGIVRHREELHRLPRMREGLSVRRDLHLSQGPGPRLAEELARRARRLT